MKKPLMNCENCFETGIRIGNMEAAVKSADRHLLSLIKKDFEFFSGISPEKPDFSVFLVRQKPPRRIMKKRIPLLKWKGASLFQKDRIRTVIYPDGSALLYDFPKEEGTIYSENMNTLRELAYLLLASRFGEKMELRGTSRLHGCAFSSRGRGFAICADPGFGKTTFILRAGREMGIKLISDDSPLITKDLKMKPFPLRIGVFPDSPFFGEFKNRFYSEFHRRERGKKFLLSPLEIFEIETNDVPLGTIILGEKKAGAEKAGIRKAGKLEKAFFAIKNVIIGWGLPQMAEISIPLTPAQLRKSLRILKTRMKLSVKIFRCEMFSYRPGKEGDEALLRFIRRNISGDAVPS